MIIHVLGNCNQFVGWRLQPFQPLHRGEVLVHGLRGQGGEAGHRPVVVGGPRGRRGLGRPRGVTLLRCGWKTRRWGYRWWGWPWGRWGRRSRGCDRIFFTQAQAFIDKIWQALNWNKRKFVRLRVTVMCKCHNNVSVCLIGYLCSHN